MLTQISTTMLSRSVTTSVGDFMALASAGNHSAAFAAAFATGMPEVFIPPGEYNIAALTIPSHVKRFYGASKASVKLAAIGSPADYTPYLYFDGISDFEVSDFSVDIDHIEHPLNHALYFGTCSDGGIYDIDMIDGGFIGAYLPACEDVTVENCIVRQSALFAISADTAPRNITVTGCRIPVAPLNGHSVTIRGGSGHKVKENRVESPAAGSFGISMLECSESVVASNIVRTTFLEGIQATDTYRVTLRDNEIFCNPALHNDMGISVYAENYDSYDNAVLGNTVHYSGTTGIGLASDSRVAGKSCTRNLVAGNKIFNPNRRNNVNYTGVWVYGSLSSANTVRDNEVDDQDGNCRYAASEYNNGDGTPNNNNLIHNILKSGNKIANELAIGAGTVIKAL